MVKSLDFASLESNVKSVRASYLVNSILTSKLQMEITSIPARVFNHSNSSSLLILRTHLKHRLTLTIGKV